LAAWFVPLMRGIIHIKDLNMNKSKRFNRGWERLKEIDGEAGERVIESLKDIAPEFADLLPEFCTKLAIDANAV
jgi:HSP90 family molecular chaperone